MAWSASGPGDVTSTTTKNAYAYGAASHVLAVTTTNAVGESSVSAFDVGRTTGLLIRFTTPLGETTTQAYDLLGRIVKATDADGLSSTMTYSTYSADDANKTL